MHEKKYFPSITISLQQILIMKKSLFVCFSIFNLNVIAQSAVRGEYYFNKQEMVAGFKFSTEGKFVFFYSYGAVDRSATGTFSITNDTLHLISDKVPGKDFSVKAQSKEGTGYRIQFEDANSYLLKHIRCSFFTGKERRDEYTDEKGVIETNLTDCDTIYAFHELFPDMASIIKDEKNESNHFVVSLNPSLGQVSFKRIEYKIVGDKIIALMPNYIFPMADVIFIKKQE